MWQPLRRVGKTAWYSLVTAERSGIVEPTCERQQLYHERITNWHGEDASAFVRPYRLDFGDGFGGLWFDGIDSSIAAGFCDVRADFDV